MHHVKMVSRTPMMAQSSLLTSGMSITETIVISVLSFFFRDWDNYSAVITGLQKFYRAT